MDGVCCDEFKSREVFQEVVKCQPGYCGCGYCGYVLSEVVVHLIIYESLNPHSLN